MSAAFSRCLMKNVGRDDHRLRLGFHLPHCFRLHHFVLHMAPQELAAAGTVRNLGLIEEVGIPRRWNASTVCFAGSAEAVG